MKTLTVTSTETIVVTNLNSKFEKVTEQMTVTNKPGFKRTFKKALEFVNTNKELTYDEIYQELVKLGAHYSTKVVPSL